MPIARPSTDWYQWVLTSAWLAGCQHLLVPNLWAMWRLLHKIAVLLAAKSHASFGVHFTYNKTPAISHQTRVQFSTALSALGRLTLSLYDWINMYISDNARSASTICEKIKMSRMTSILVRPLKINCMFYLSSRIQFGWNLGKKHAKWFFWFSLIFLF